MVFALRQVSVRNKIFSLLAASAAVMILLLVIFLVLMTLSERQSRNALNEASVRSAQLFSLITSSIQAEGSVQKILQEKDADKLEVEIASLDSVTVSIGNGLAAVGMASGEEAEIWGRLKKENGLILDDVLKGKQADAQARYMEGAIPLLDQMLLHLDTFRASQAEQDTKALASAQSRSSALKIIFIIIALGLIGLLIWTGWRMANAIAEPLRLAAERLHDIAQGEGDLTQRLVAQSEDEVGKLAQGFNLFAGKLQNMIKDIAGQAADLSTSTRSLSGTSERINSNAEQMTGQSTSVTEASERVSSQVQGISSAAEEMSGSVNTVAAAIQELSASLNEVARNCQKESQVTTRADHKAKGTKEMVERLGTAAKEIGKVVEVINDIADQTNLLALNATIEAASAGDAGKGFAVVAGEVKELARQTSQATEEIRRQVEGMQGNTTEAVKAMMEIAGIIEEIHLISQTIVAAVEEQTATVNEVAHSMNGASSAASDIAKNVSGSAKDLSNVSTNIEKVNVAAQNTAEGVSEIRKNVQNLATLTGNLQKIVVQFKV